MKKVIYGLLFISLRILNNPAFDIIYSQAIAFLDEHSQGLYIDNLVDSLNLKLH